MNNVDGEQVFYIGSKGQLQENNPKLKQTKYENNENQNPKISSIVIKQIESQSFLKVESQFYYLQVSMIQNKNQKIKQTSEIKNLLKWTISRRYSDFQWLFKAIMFQYPGYILPYFPCKTMQSFIVLKLNLSYGKSSKKQQLQRRQQQLQQFINQLLLRETIQNSIEMKIFIEKQNQKFVKKKAQIEQIMLQSRQQQNNSNKIFSVMQRGLAWLTSSRQTGQQKIHSNENWKNLQEKIDIIRMKIDKLVVYFENLVKLKQEQINWQCPSTQIDSIEILKTKIISGQKYTKDCIESLQKQIIIKLIETSFKVNQVYKQLEERQKIIQMIEYLQKMDKNQQRINKLYRKKQIFENTIIKQWFLFNKQINNKINKIYKNYNFIWQQYNSKMIKIWK